MDHHQGALSFLHWDPVCKASHWQSQVPLTFIEHHLGDIDHSVETFKRHCEKSFFLHEKIHEAGGNWSLGWRERGARGWVCSGCHLCPSINHPWPRGELCWAGGHREGEHCNLGKPGAWTGGLPGEIGKWLIWCNMIDVLGNGGWSLPLSEQGCNFQHLYLFFFPTGDKCLRPWPQNTETGDGFCTRRRIFCRSQHFDTNSLLHFSLKYILKDLWNENIWNDQGLAQAECMGRTIWWRKMSCWLQWITGSDGYGLKDEEIDNDEIPRSIKKFAIKVIFQGWGLWGFWV